MIDSGIKKDAVQYTMDTIKYVCEEIGPRESGMEAEKRAQEFFAKEIKDNNWADEVLIDEFTISRHALVGFTKIIGVFLIVASIIQFLGLINTSVAVRVVSIISLSLVLLSLTILFFEFILYKEFIDWALPQSQSRNVYAKYKPTGKVTRRIVINGHVDSAYEWTLMRINQNFMVAALVTCLIFALVSLAFYITNAVRGFIPWYSYLITSLGGVSYIALFFVCTFKTLSPGANDNLTGTLTAITTLKCLKESGIRFEHTEVAALLTGSEEAGLRGAKAWAKKYKDEINEVETAVIVFDTLRDYDWAMICHRDMTGVVKNSDRVSALLLEAAKKANHPIREGNVPFGASDAAALSREGVHASLIIAQNQLGTDYYHTRNDTPDNMCEKTVALGLDIALAAVELFDEHGLPRVE